jgi:hypothetical protein
MNRQEGLAEAPVNTSNEVDRDQQSQEKKNHSQILTLGFRCHPELTDLNRSGAQLENQFTLQYNPELSSFLF